MSQSAIADCTAATPGGLLNIEPQVQGCVLPQHGQALSAAMNDYTPHTATLNGLAKAAGLHPIGTVLPNTPSAAQIKRLEREMLAMAQLEIETRHHFAPGQYAREIVIPEGTLLTGKTHKTEHLNVVSKGDITVWTESGMRRIKAPFIFVSKPGTKRVGLAHEETVWITVHATSETDLAKLEAELIEPELIGSDEEVVCLG